MDTEKRRDFDAVAAQWDDNPIRAGLARDIALAIHNKANLNKKMTVLDFGCGTGLLTTALSPYVGSITGLDSSKGMIDQLSLKIAKARLTNVFTIHADPEKGDRIPGSYDLIVSSMALHHIRDIQSLVNTFYDLLKTSGTVAVADLDSEEGRFHGDNTGVFHQGFDRNTLRKIFSRAGFGHIQTTTATTINKPSADGNTTNPFTIFLLSGHK